MPAKIVSDFNDVQDPQLKIQQEPETVELDNRKKHILVKAEKF